MILDNIVLIILKLFLRRGRIIVFLIYLYTIFFKKYDFSNQNYDFFWDNNRIKNNLRQEIFTIYRGDTN